MIWFFILLFIFTLQTHAHHRKTNKQTNASFFVLKSLFYSDFFFFFWQVTVKCQAIIHSLLLLLLLLLLFFSIWWYLVIHEKKNLHSSLYYPVCVCVSSESINQSHIYHSKENHIDQVAKKKNSSVITLRESKVK